MIGFQELLLKQNIKTKEMAKQMGVNTGTITGWINNKVPKKHLNTLSKIFNVDEDYLNKQVNDISTYSPRAKGFNKYNIKDNITEIYVTRKDGTQVTFLIDTEDLPKLIELNYSWNAVWDEGVDNYYAVSTHYYRDENNKRKQETILLTEIIMNYKPIDHIDHDTKNNRKYNLRKTEHVKNATNRRGKNSNNKSGYRNVLLDKKSGKYIIMLCIKNKRFRVGKYYTDVHEAGKDAEMYRIQYYGADFAGKS